MLAIGSALAIHYPRDAGVHRKCLAAVIKKCHLASVDLVTSETPSTLEQAQP